MWASDPAPFQPCYQKMLLFFQKTITKFSLLLSIPKNVYKNVDLKSKF